MIEVKASTKKGQRLVQSGRQCTNKCLKDIYNRWSRAKQEAYNHCWNEYIYDKMATAFGIGNANSFGFTASWLTQYKGEDVMRIETKDNSYLIWLER